MHNYFLVRLKEIRKEKKLSQKRLAELSGISVYKISKWEKCVSYPDIFDAVALCIPLDVQVEYLRGNSPIKDVTKYKPYSDEDNRFRCVTFD